MSFSFGGGGFGTSPYSVAPTGFGMTTTTDPFAGANEPSMGTLDKIEEGTQSLAGIVSGVRSIWDSTFGNGSGDSDPLTQSGDVKYTDDGSGGAGSAAKRTFENLWETIKTTFEEGARSGLEGAAATSEGARRGANAGASLTGLNTTLILGVALVAVFFLRK